MTRASQQMHSEIPVNGKRLPIGQNMVLPAPEQAGWHADAAQSRAQIKALHAIGKQQLRHIRLHRAQGRVAAPLLSAPVEDRRNWTLSRLADEIARREGFSISRSQFSKVLRKKGGSASGGPGTC